MSEQPFLRLIVTAEEEQLVSFADRKGLLTKSLLGQEPITLTDLVGGWGWIHMKVTPQSRLTYEVRSHFSIGIGRRLKKALAGHRVGPKSPGAEWHQIEPGTPVFELVALSRKYLDGGLLRDLLRAGWTWDRLNDPQLVQMARSRAKRAESIAQ